MFQVCGTHFVLAIHAPEI